MALQVKIQLDPRKIRKIKEVKREKDKETNIDKIKSIEEYFIYNDKGINYNEDGHKGRNDKRFSPVPHD